MSTSGRAVVCRATLVAAMLLPMRPADAGKAAGRLPESGGARLFGNMPLVLDPDPHHFPFHFAHHHIAEDSSLLVLHMDWFPIPWKEFATGGSLPPAWLREMDAIDALRQELNLPVYLALTPIDQDHLKGQAWGDAVLSADDSFSRGCEAIASRPDYLSVVRPGYRAFVEYMVQRFQPTFLALSIEVNNYTEKCPSAWNDMKALLNEVYEMQKAQHPGLTVFHTFQVENLWDAEDGTRPCSDFRKDCLDRNLAPLANLETDLFALSVYPEATIVNHAGFLPDDYLGVFAGRTGKPLAISETGYTAITISGLLPGGICFPGLPSSAADQDAWMRRLLLEAGRLDMPFVVWWANEDLGPVAELTGCRCTTPSPLCAFLTAIGDAAQGIRFFGTMGLRDFSGTPRPALATWRREAHDLRPWRTLPGPGRGSGPPPRRAGRSPAEGEIVLAILAKPELGEAGNEIFTMNLDGSNRQQITDNDKQEFLPHFSPRDGKRLVFTRYVNGTYSIPGAETRVIVYDFATRTERDLGEGSQPVWSPDGSRLAFMCKRFAPSSLCLMNADASGAREVARPRGDDTDLGWGDPAWSIDDWILLAVGEDRGGSCFKVRLDKIRPDGTNRTQVTDGGPNCTPPGKEQSGDADPGFSADGRTIFSSRGYPNPPAGGIPAMTERRLISVSADAWFPGKEESDLSLPAFPSGIEGVPKGSPDGRRVLLFRACFAQGAGGIALTDNGGTFRRFLGDGFGPDWHPLADSYADRDARATWRTYATASARLSPVVPPASRLDAAPLEADDGSALVLESGSVDGAPLAAFDAEWRLTEERSSLVSLSFRLRAAIAGGSGPVLALLLYNFQTARFETLLVENPASSAFSIQQIEWGDLCYVQPEDGRVRARVLATGPPGGSPFDLVVDQLHFEILAVGKQAGRLTRSSGP